MHVCSIASTKYLPGLFVLANSFHEHNPGSTMWVFVMDDLWEEFADFADNLKVIPLSALSLSVSDYREMASFYTDYELATAIKPWVVEAVIATTGQSVAYFDSDMRIYSDCSFIEHLATTHGTVVTPHLLEPYPDDDLQPQEATYLTGGSYNCGFVAFGPQGLPLVRWWQRKLRRHCIQDLARGYFVDQHWMDLGISMFGGHVLRHKGMNIALWNIEQRPLTARNGRVWCGDDPLVMFHYSGFDPKYPDVLNPRVSHVIRRNPSDDPVLAGLTTQYADELLAAGWSEARSLPCRTDLSSDGVLISPLFRRLARERVVSGRALTPPDLFGSGGAAEFIRWLGSDLPAETGAMADWLAPHGSLGSTHAVNVVGCFDDSVGGQLTELITTVVAETHVGSVIDTRAGIEPTRRSALGDTNLVIGAMCDLASWTCEIGRPLLSGRRNIAVVWLHANRDPQLARNMSGVFDEIWTIDFDGDPAMDASLGRQTFRFPVDGTPEDIRAFVSDRLGHVRCAPVEQSASSLDSAAPVDDRTIVISATALAHPHVRRFVSDVCESGSRDDVRIVVVAVGETAAAADELLTACAGLQLEHAPAIDIVEPSELSSQMAESAILVGGAQSSTALATLRTLLRANP